MILLSNYGLFAGQPSIEYRMGPCSSIIRGSRALPRVRFGHADHSDTSNLRPVSIYWAKAVSRPPSHHQVWIVMTGEEREDVESIGLPDDFPGRAA